MWLFTGAGFVSLVRDRDDVNKVWVRARIPGDIEALLPQYAGEVIMKPGSDYLYRLLAPKAEVAMALSMMIMDLSYTGHAKEAMVATAPRHATRYSALMSTWNIWSAEQYPYGAYSTKVRPPRTEYKAPASTSYRGTSNTHVAPVSGSYNTYTGAAMTGKLNKFDDERWDEGFGESPVDFGIPEDYPTGSAIPATGSEILFSDGLTNDEFNNMTQVEYDTYLVSIGMTKKDVYMLTPEERDLAGAELIEPEQDEKSWSERLYWNAYPAPADRPKKGTKEFRMMRTAQRRYQRWAEKQRAQGKTVQTGKVV